MLLDNFVIVQKGGKFPATIKLCFCLFDYNLSCCMQCFTYIVSCYTFFSSIFTALFVDWSDVMMWRHGQHLRPALWRASIRGTSRVQHLVPGLAKPAVERTPHQAAGPSDRISLCLFIYSLSEYDDCLKWHRKTLCYISSQGGKCDYLNVFYIRIKSTMVARLEGRKQL